MRIRWLPVVLTLSLAANVGLALGWMGQILSEGVLASDTQSSFRLLAGERDQLQSMREHFCPHDPSPTRDALLAWEASAHQAEQHTHTFDKDGLLWLGVDGTGIKFDASDRLAGVCLSRAWFALDHAPLQDEDRAGELCPLEPLC